MWTISYVVFASTHIDQVCSCVLHCTEDLVIQMKHQSYKGHNILPEYKQYSKVIVMCISYKIIYLQERSRRRGIMVSKALTRSITTEYCDRYLPSTQYIRHGTTFTILLNITIFLHEISSSFLLEKYMLQTNVSLGKLLNVHARAKQQFF